MKILRVYFRLPPLKGGMENHIKYLSLEQAKFHEVTIAFSNGAEIDNVNCLRVLSRLNLFTKKVNPLTASLFYLTLIIKIIRANQSYDVVHLHGDWSSFLFGPLLKIASNAKNLAFSLHGTLETHNLIARFFLKKTLSFADVVFSTGKETYDQIMPFCKKIVFQPSGVASDFFDNSMVKGDNRCNNRKKIITIANLVPAKNVQCVLRIAMLNPNYDFIIIGEGKDRWNLQEFLERNKIENVFLSGSLQVSEIINYLDVGDVFLLTSILEGTPTAVMEAMARGLPIVCSNAGGTESLVINDINGYVIKHDYNDAKSYSEAIDLIVKRRELYETMSLNNIEKAQLFKWNVVAQRISSEMLY
jgi:glycosyltransferase involved in cell wall biosynthesis